MLETLLIWGLILLPLGIAIVLIADRARFFMLGIAGIVLVLALIWAALRLGIVSSQEPQSTQPPAGSLLENISCEAADPPAVFANCRL